MSLKDYGKRHGKDTLKTIRTEVLSGESRTHVASNDSSNVVHFPVVKHSHETQHAEEQKAPKLIGPKEQERKPDVSESTSSAASTNVEGSVEGSVGGPSNSVVLDRTEFESEEDRKNYYCEHYLRMLKDPSLRFHDVPFYIIVLEALVYHGGSFAVHEFNWNLQRRYAGEYIEERCNRVIEECASANEKVQLMVRYDRESNRLYLIDTCEV